MLSGLAFGGPDLLLKGRPAPAIHRLVALGPHSGLYVRSFITQRL